MSAARWTTLWGILAIVDCFMAGFCTATREWVAAALFGVIGVYALLRTIENAHEEERR